MKNSIESKVFKNYKHLRKKLDGISGELYDVYHSDNPNFGPLVLMPLAQKFKMPIKAIKKIIADQRSLAKAKEIAKQDKIRELASEKKKLRDKCQKDFSNYMLRQKELQAKKSRNK